MLTQFFFLWGGAIFFSFSLFFHDKFLRFQWSEISNWHKWINVCTCLITIIVAQVPLNLIADKLIFQLFCYTYVITKHKTISYASLFSDDLIKKMSFLVNVIGLWPCDNAKSPDIKFHWNIVSFCTYDPWCFPWEQFSSTQTYYPGDHH